MRRLVSIAVVSLCILAVFGMSHAEDVKVGTVSGQLMIKGGGPMSGGMVFLYNIATGPPPSSDKYWRVPDFVAETDDKGRFSVELLEGKYCLGAIKREAKKLIGPPIEGDYLFISRDEKGTPREYVIKKGEKLDVGVIAEAVPYKRSVVKEGITAIEGYVQDADGKPVEGVLVFAFVTPTIVGKPLFVSDKTAKDGKYILRVHAGGNYYLKTRNVYGGGPPLSGEIVDSYGEQAPVAPVEVRVKTGEIVKGINLKGVKFPGRGPNTRELQPFGKKGGEVNR
ncbi:MAG: hypothetical protein FD174_3346 [Geobacteraceae bacterium]|nr:MAG: hypothetical protein FD174_3346 [Geobacteraceae bacterium]